MRGPGARQGQRLYPQFTARLLDPRATVVSICCQRQGPPAGPAGTAGSREEEWTAGLAKIRASQGSAIRSREEGRSRRGLPEGRCLRVAWMGSWMGQGEDTATHKPDPAAVGGGLGDGGWVDSPGGLGVGDDLGGWGLGNWGLGAGCLPCRAVGTWASFLQSKPSPHSDGWGVACLRQRDPPSPRSARSQLLRTPPRPSLSAPPPSQPLRVRVPEDG